MGDKEKDKAISAKAPSRPVLTPEQIASRQRAHEMKVAKFLAGGKF